MTAASRRQIEERFTLLEDRVFRIELRLGPETTSPSTAAHAHAQAPAAPPPFAATPIVEADASPVQRPVERRERLVEEKGMRQPMAVSSPPPVTSPSSPPTPVSVSRVQIAYATPQSPAPAVQGAFERTIGLKWAGWVGAVVLVIGAAFGVKFVYDQHWFGEVPPAVWLSAIFFAGVALIGTGEAIYRRVHVIPAASVFGAGVATLFLAGYVGHAYYNLYSPGTALFLMATAALVGALVARRGNLVSIAVLSHLGANVAPLLVGSRSAPLESFLIYLLALQMVSLTLANWGRGKKWWTLRCLSLVTTSLWVVATGLRPGEESLVTIFSIIYAALYHGELIQSALRRRGDASPTVGGPDAVTFTLVVTASLTLVILWATRLLPADVCGAILVTMSAISASIGWALLRAKTGTEIRGAVRKISTAHRTAAAALVALAVPATFSGLQADFGWGVLAIAFAVTGNRTRSKIAGIASIVIWILAVGHVALATFLLPEFGGHQPKIWFRLSGTAITRDAMLAFGLSVIGQIIAGLFIPGNASDNQHTRRTAFTLSAMATALWVVASVVSLPPLAATAWIVEYAWLLVAVDALVPQLQFSLQAAALLLLATVKWIIVDTLADRLAPGWSPNVYRPVFNPLMGIGALLCASIITLWSIRGRAIWRALRKQDEVPTGSMVVIMGVVVVLMTLGLSFEIDRVIESTALLHTLTAWPIGQEKLLALTVLWTVSTMALMGTVAAIEPPGQGRSRWFKRLWILPALLAAKYVLIDTAPLWGATASVSLLLNLQVLAAVLIAGCLLLGSRLSGQNDAGDLTIRRLRNSAMLLATGVLMWALTLEIDRLVEQMQVAGTLHWPLWQAKQLAWTMAWSIAAAGAFAILRWRDPDAPATESWPHILPGFLMLMAFKYLTIDTLVWRLLRTPANVTVLANLEASAGAVVLASFVMLLVLGLPSSMRDHEIRLRRKGFLFAALILLWSGSIEIDRYYVAAPIFFGAGRPEQVTLSIFWAVFAVACVLLGFRLRAAALRFFGLGLLAITLLKVVVIDMSQVQTGYRILSFMGLGALLLGTSVLYGKFGPRLLQEGEEEESPLSMG